MATFKVGQRVRRIESHKPGVFGQVGWCGAVTGFGYPGQKNALDVLYDNGFHAISCMVSCFVPLTDPSADSFIETVKSWGPLHEEPKVKKHEWTTDRIG